MTSLFDIARFTPHGFCLAWEPVLVWLLASSDMLIAAAYFSIPAALLIFVRCRTDLAFKPIFALFAAFILACGSTHVLGAVTLWVPLYRIDAIINVITAVLSVATAATLWPLIPKALALPSPAALRRANAALAREAEQSRVSAEKLRVSEQSQRARYARSPAARVALDTSGVIIDVTDRWLTLLGYGRREVLGRRLFDFYTAESALHGAVNLGLMQEGGGELLAQRRLVCHNGRVLDVEMTGEVERDRDGRVVGMQASVIDIGPRLAAQAALGAAEERLRQAQKMEAVGQLTGGIAHDFNNLLTTILGAVELLSQQPGLDDRGRRMAANAIKGAQSAARLTSQLLAFSRQQVLTPERLKPGEVVQGIADMLARTVGDRIALTLHDTSKGWAMLADRNQTESALLNLVINARDAIQADGTVTVSIHQGTLAPGHQPEPDVPAGDYVVLAVSDTGPGMSEEVIARACEPFFTTKPAGTGTGLGLSQVYGFARQSGGRLVIESAPGAGTRVEIWLPRVQYAAPPPEEPAFLPAPHGDGAHILLVEDDPLLRQTVAEALSVRGFTVSTAHDGQQALTLLRAHRDHIALLFTDVMMPGALSGVGLALAARLVLPDLPVILATGYSPDSVLQGWPETSDIMSKPYTPDDVAWRIARKLGK